MLQAFQTILFDQVLQWLLRVHLPHLRLSLPLSPEFREIQLHRLNPFDRMVLSNLKRQLDPCDQSALQVPGHHRPQSPRGHRSVPGNQEYREIQLDQLDLFDLFVQYFQLNRKTRLVPVVPENLCSPLLQFHQQNRVLR